MLMKTMKQRFKGIGVNIHLKAAPVLLGFGGRRGGIFKAGIQSSMKTEFIQLCSNTIEKVNKMHIYSM